MSKLSARVILIEFCTMIIMVADSAESGDAAGALSFISTQAEGIMRNYAQQQMPKNIINYGMGNGEATILWGDDDPID